MSCADLFSSAVCQNKDVCPLWTDPDTGNRIAATGCSSDSMLPTNFELKQGKRLTCNCGGAPVSAPLQDAFQLFVQWSLAWCS